MLRLCPFFVIFILMTPAATMVYCIHLCNPDKECFVNHLFIGNINIEYAVHRAVHRLCIECDSPCALVMAQFAFGHGAVRTHYIRLCIVRKIMNVQIKLFHRHSPVIRMTIMIIASAAFMTAIVSSFMTSSVISRRIFG